MAGAVRKHDLLCDLVLGLTGIGAVRESVLCHELMLIFSCVCSASRELSRSMQLCIFQSWLISDCIREAIRTVVNLIMHDADQPVSHDMSKVWIISLLT